MGIKTQFCKAVVTLALLMGLAESSETDSSRKKLDGENVSHPMALRYLGVADGKAFFVETTSTRTWTSARTYCNDSLLTLASIDSRPQLEFLREALTHGPSFWTSARDSRLPSMLRWDATDGEVNDALFDSWSFDATDYFVCGALYPSEALLVARSCASLMNTLCQTTDILVKNKLLHIRKNNL